MQHNARVPVHAMPVARRHTVSYAMSDTDADGHSGAGSDSHSGSSSSMVARRMANICTISGYGGSTVGCGGLGSGPISTIPLPRRPMATRWRGQPMDSAAKQANPACCVEPRLQRACSVSRPNFER